MLGSRQDAESRVAGGSILLQTYKDHNLVRVNGKVFAVPLSLGPIDLTRENTESIPQILAAQSIESAKQMLDTEPRTPTLSRSSRQERLEPKLIVEGYKQFNLIFYGEKYYGILQRDGAFDARRIPANAYTCIFAADTLNALKSRIDAIPF